MEDIKVPFHEKRTTTISFLFVFKVSFCLKLFDKNKKNKKIIARDSNTVTLFVLISLPKEYCQLCVRYDLEH